MPKMSASSSLIVACVASLSSHTLTISRMLRSVCSSSQMLPHTSSTCTTFIFIVPVHSSFMVSPRCL
uniref:Putative secreted protein n=1 Tax=Anopheles triannulatus TaxID=58253 RepID=A0A2M4B5X8_9DIPT